MRIITTKKSQLTMNSFQSLLDGNCSKQCAIALKSIRAFDEIKIEVWASKYSKIKRLKEILSRHHPSIRKFTLVCSEISERKLFKMLASLPHLEEISLDVTLTKVSKSPNQRLKCLSQLKSLQCRSRNISIIFELPSDVLQSLSFEFMYCDEAPSPQSLQEIFHLQKNLKVLSLNPEANSNIQLPSLEKLRLVRRHKLWTYPNIRHVGKMLEDQNQLKSLNIQSVLAEEDFLKICSIRSLESLEIELENADDTLMRNINRLTGLSQLGLALYSYKSKFSSVKLPHLKILNLLLVDNDKKTQLDLSQMPRNFPCLRQLKILSNSQMITLESLPDLLGNKNLVKLDVNMSNGSDQSFDCKPTQHYGLKEVLLGFKYSRNALHYIIKATPHLEKLFTGIESLGDLQHILTNCKKLTHLKLFIHTGDFHFDDFVELLQSFGRSLTYFECEMERSDILGSKASLLKLEKSFNTQFTVIDIQMFNRLIMKNVSWTVDTFPVYS